MKESWSPEGVVEAVVPEGVVVPFRSRRRRLSVAAALVASAP